MKYSYVVIYVKRTNLLAFYDHDPSNQHPTERERERYAKERPVRLVMSVRHDNNRAFCRIKCPINPLPVKGEFEVPNMAVIQRFLEREGWAKIDVIPAAFFK